MITSNQASKKNKQDRIDLRLSRWPKPALIPLFCGSLWLFIIISHGVASSIIGFVPAGLMFSSAASTLLWSGDRRAPQFLAIGALLGTLLLIPLIFFIGGLNSLLLLICTIACWLTAGWIAFRLDPVHQDALAPKVTLATMAGAALDEAFLCYVINTRPLPNVNEIDSIHRETVTALEQFSANGWLEDPASFHTRPPALQTPTMTTAEHRGREIEFMSFKSEYEPHPNSPGRDRWLSYENNTTAYATVMRHHDGLPRPWLIGIHGFQMGYPLADLLIFDPKFYHEELGLNVILPTLPLHGRRRIGKLSGDGFLAGNIMDTIHAEAQAQWDLRRILSWVKEEETTPKIGLLGYSLGGYNAALLSSLVSKDEADIASIIAAIPAIDIPHLFWRHGPPHMLRYMDSLGISQTEATEIMKVVSPTALPCQISHDKRFIVAASADRVTPPTESLQLWEHWERPHVKWYQGSHLTVRHHLEGRDTILRGLREGGLIDQ